MEKVMLVLATGEWYAVFWMFLAGLAMALNPHMLIMAPAAGGFVSRKAGSLRDAASLSLKLLLGYATTLGLLGMFAALLGGQVPLQSPLWRWVPGIILIAMGLSYWRSFLFFIPRVVWFYQRPSPRTAAKPLPSLGIWGLGAALALTPSPCTTPVVIAVLTFASPTGSWTTAFTWLFSFGIGHGIPLLVFTLIGGNMAMKIPPTWTRFFHVAMGLLMIVLAVIWLTMKTPPLHIH